MIYYFFLALVDIGWYLWDNKFNLSATLVASGVGVILGKRIGTRIAINYIIRRLGISKKSITEQKVDWLIEQERVRGNVWSAELSNLKTGIIGKSFRARWGLRFLVRFITLFTRRKVTDQLTLRGKKNMDLLKSNLSKKLVVTITATLLIAMNDKFALGMTQETIYVIAGVVATYVAGQAHVDAKKQESAQFH